MLRIPNKQEWIELVPPVYWGQVWFLYQQLFVEHTHIHYCLHIYEWITAFYHWCPIYWNIKYDQNEYKKTFYNIATNLSSCCWVLVATTHGLGIENVGLIK